MITIIDIIRCLSEKISERCPDFPINDRDLDENIPRPSYYIDVEELRSSTITSHYRQESADIVIYFFAEDIYSGFLELLKVKNELEDMLDAPLEISEYCHALFTDVNVTISNTDKALICNCTTTIVQDVNREPNLPLIEEIEITNEVN